MTRQSLGPFALLLALFPLACGGSAPAPATRSAATPAAEAPLPAIDGNAVLQHIKVLASDEYQGRFPGTKGEDLSVAYIQQQFQDLGLAPGNTDGTYIQHVPLVGITPDPSASLVFRKGSHVDRLKFKDDFVASTRRVKPTVSLDNSSLVFVGYGVQAPEYHWDDYKGMDVKGKTLVMLVGDPPVPDPNDPAKLDPKMFGGPAMTYYGRWTYKYEIGAKLGAAGVIIVHETGPAGYPFSVLQSSTGEAFTLETPDGNMNRAAIESWITRDQAVKLFKMAGKDFDALKAAAVKPDFKPVPLGVTASITLHNTIRRIQSRNVIAKLEGSDPALKDEYVIYTAHWDHLGIGPAVNGDDIYNGAVDNASGVAGLIELARAFKQLPTPPKRSILFMAVTAEEQGLLGSEYYATHPIYPLAKTLADINMDAMNVWGKTKDLTIVGLGNSQLDDYARRAAAAQGRVLRPDPTPEKGFYYRSDHFNFAKVGVPALDPDSGVDYVGKPDGYGTKVHDDYIAHDYHQPSDQVKPDWDMSGEAQDLELLMRVGYDVAQASSYPQWTPGTEFAAIRAAQLKAAGISR
ncbi:MAG: M20/M25/M40 family metallo-hydrolase [Acidobacteriota bacterium]|nr:M20/M25/M40 family metallo-hydrolase [Acidobacteriota bacterium]